MKAIHALGIIHRDLKPENLLLFDHPELSFRVKLADFGFSKLVQDNRSVVVDQRGNQGNVIKGTFAYLPPETLEGSAPSYMTDVYAFGIMANEILRQCPPYHPQERNVSGGTSAGTTSSVNLTGENLLLHVKQGNRPYLVDKLKNVTVNHDILLTACRDIITGCWNQRIEKRPNFHEITEFLESTLKLAKQSIIHGNTNSVMMTVIPSLDAIREEIIPIEQLTEEQVVTFLTNMRLPQENIQRVTSVDGYFLKKADASILMQGYGFSIIHAHGIVKELEELDKRGGVPMSRLTASTNGTAPVSKSGTVSTNKTQSVQGGSKTTGKGQSGNKGKGSVDNV